MYTQRGDLMNSVIGHEAGGDQFDRLASGVSRICQQRTSFITGHKPTLSIPSIAEAFLENRKAVRSCTSDSPRSCCQCDRDVTLEKHLKDSLGERLVFTQIMVELTMWLHTGDDNTFFSRQQIECIKLRAK